MIASAARTFAVGLIGMYRRFVSPLVPRACRFIPSCSEYGAVAIVSGPAPANTSTCCR